jgi:chitodextrinase
MTPRHPFWVAARAAALALILALVLGTSPALAARDRKPPTKPTNLRATSVTAHNVTLAWNLSTDDSGTFSYRVWVSYGFTHSVPQTQTTFSLGLVPNNTYSFYVYAVDGSGNISQRSNTLSVTTLRDTTPPSPPVVSLVGVNPTEIALQWTASTDDGLHVLYQVFVNGSPNGAEIWNVSAVVRGLTPETTYEITVKARDLYGQNVSAPSNVLTVTTSAVSATDTEPPSSPGCCGGGDVGGLELNIFWGQSFDNQTPQASIAYEIYLNGVLDHTTSGDRAVLYTTQFGENTVTLVAVDNAGNRSEPSTVTFFVQ